jgi:hypothetical protein
VDVANVPRGGKCGCICPSCKTPLIARQGDLKEWHFAHRTRNVHQDTKSECEYSFNVSVRLMIRQLAMQGLSFRAPRYAGVLEAHSEISLQSHRADFVVTEESLIVLSDLEIGASFSHTTVDILGHVDDVPLVVYITYEGREIPADINPPEIKRCGVVKVEIGSLLHAFKQEKEGRYAEVLRGVLEEGTEGKAWVYHPREAQARDGAKAKLEEWLSKQKPPAVFDPIPRLAGSRSSRSKKSKPLSPTKSVSSHYECVMCHSRWSGISAKCLKCATHLYARVSENVRDDK